MSFSSKVKDEILENISKVTNTCCINAEKFGENITYVHLKSELVNEDTKDFFDISKLNECCLRSVLMGAFLSSGCIVDPALDYHFEIVIKNKACADYIYNILSLLEFTPKILKRKKTNSYIVYFKESEQISIFLSVIGVSKALLKFEEIRVEKDVKNNINRNVNCETANIAKTANAAIKQCEAINMLKKKKKFDILNDKLKYIANLRLKYPEASLEELSLKTSGIDKISKSGIKHRLDKIIKIANELI